MLRPLSLALPLLGGCSDEPLFARVGSPLFARQSSLWPVANGVAQVRVCWLPMDLAGETFPVVEHAPQLQQLEPKLKRVVQAGVEAQWNARTPVQFIGWGECGAAEADIRVRPISSQYQAKGCGTSAKGQACAEWLGKDLASNAGVVNVNVLFGEEVRYSSRYQQAAGSSYRSNLDLAYWWLPMACMADFKRPWTTNNPESPVKADINQPQVAADFDARYERCLQNSAVHEFGHAAGFAHEQYRTDDAAKQKSCYDAEQARGLSDDQPQNIATRYRGTSALGAFDSESIMSYCRTDPSPLLTAEDVANVYAAYGVTPPTNSASGGNTSAGGGGASGSASLGGVAGRAGASGSAGASGLVGAGGVTGGTGASGVSGGTSAGGAAAGRAAAAGESGQNSGTFSGGHSASGSAGAFGAAPTGGGGGGAQTPTGGVAAGGLPNAGASSSAQGGLSTSSSGNTTAAGSAGVKSGMPPGDVASSGCAVSGRGPRDRSYLALGVLTSLCAAARRRRASRSARFTQTSRRAPRNY